MRTLTCILLVLGSVAGQDPSAEVRRFLEAGEVEQAGVAFRRGLARPLNGPTRSDYLRAVFQACEQEGALGALRNWLQAESQGADGVLLYYLGFVETRLMFLQRGERSLKAALANDPGSPALLSMLATVASRRFRHEEAARLARRAGPAGQELASREARLEQSLSSAAPRQWGAIILGLIALAGLALFVRRRAS